MPVHPGPAQNCGMFRARRVMRRRAIAARRDAVGSREEPANDVSDQASPREAGPDPADQLAQLHELRQQGILTEEEFSAEKKKLLDI
jgi:hypothetical protein